MATISEYRVKPRGQSAEEAQGKRANIRYRVRYRTPEGRQTDKRGFATKRDAQAFAATVEVQKMTGEFVAHKAGRTTVNELGSTWAELAKANLSPGSWRNYETAWRVHVQPKWGGVSVKDINLLAVDTWLASMPRADGKQGRPSAPTIERAYTVLLGILDVAVKGGKLKTNPARGATLPRRIEKRRVYLEAKQVKALASAAGPHGDLVLTLAFTGLRWGEAAALRVSSWDASRSRLAVTATCSRVGSTIIEGPPKDHEHRSVPVPLFLAERLCERTKGLEPDALIFPGVSGFLPAPDVRHGWFVKALQAAGLPRITPHDLRHTCASLAVSSGAHVKALQRMLGHAKASMTLDTYADLFDTDLDGVADALNERWASI